MSDPLRERLAALLPTGQAQAISADRLAFELNTSARTVGHLVAELIDEGWLIGSTCGVSGGYYLPTSEAEVEAGVAHIVSRAKASLRRVAVLRRNARERFGVATDRLFDLDEVAS